MFITTFKRITCIPSYRLLLEVFFQRTTTLRENATISEGMRHDARRRSEVSSHGQVTANNQSEYELYGTIILRFNKM